MALQILVEPNEEAHARKRGFSRVEHMAAHARGIGVAEARLEVGDYAVVWTPADGGDARLLVLIERKTVDDFHASILDGRYADQALRLERTAVPRAVWLVTGALPADATERHRIQTAMAHLTVSANICVLQTGASDADFAHLVQALAHKAHARYVDGAGFAELPVHKVAMDQGRRPRLDTQAAVWPEQLTVPRGLSLATARAVAQRFPSAVALLRALRRQRDSYAPPAPSRRKRPATVDDHLDAVLADIPCARGRVGPAAARTIWQTLVAPADLDAIVP